MYPKLTDEEISAIVLWKKENPQHWKSKLLTAWMTCNFKNFYYSNRLQNLRNSHGPSWLASFNLKKALLEYTLIQIEERN